MRWDVQGEEQAKRLRQGAFTPTRGSTGIIDSVSASGFTITTATGLAVNITETASTKVVGGPASAVRKGTSVLVLGLDDSTTTATSTITADTVVIQPFGDGGAAAAKRDGVIPISTDTTGSTKVVGTIPSDYTEGDGTINGQECVEDRADSL